MLLVIVASVYLIALPYLIMGERAMRFYYRCRFLARVRQFAQVESPETLFEIALVKVAHLIRKKKIPPADKLELPLTIKHELFRRDL